MTEQPPCKPSCRRVQRREWRRDLVLFGALMAFRNRGHAYPFRVEEGVS